MADVVDSPMLADPPIVLPDPIVLLSDDLKGLWRKALKRPEADLQRRVADSIARADREGVQGLEDMIDPLIAVLKSSKPHPIVKQSVAQALVVLDAQRAAASLFRHLGGEGLAYAQIVEPALGRWQYRPIRKVWLERLSEPNSRPGALLLAIRGTRKLGDQTASSEFWRMAQAVKLPPQVRMEAAYALAEAQPVGLVDRARQLAGEESSPLLDRLVAAALLCNHSDDRSRKLLLEMAVDPEPAVASIALKRLVEYAPLSVVPIVERLLARQDGSLRRHAARALAADPTTASTNLLGPLLDDPHLKVRSFVRSTLQQRASTQQLKTAVVSQATGNLNASGWRGQEQAALLLGGLGHKPASARLVELLEAKRPEVAVAAAWALRKLALPETLSALLSKADRESRGRRKNDEQLRQLIQTFGQMRYRPALSLLRRFIPKNSDRWENRVAAIWALGHIETTERRAGLVRSLTARLSDLNLMDPEADQVRQMAAISLGRVKASEALSALREFYRSEGSNTGVGLACRWAIQHLTGETLPEPKQPTIYRRGWFLEPVSSGFIKPL